MEQEEIDLIDRLGLTGLIDKFKNFRNKHSLAHSIRKRGKDEIEIRASTFDGYIRGFIRAVLVGIFLVGTFFDLSHGKEPFSDEIRTIREDFIWTFNKDKELLPMYEEYREWVLKPETKAKYPNERLLSYEEYRKLYTDESWSKWHVIRTIFHFIWPPILLFSIFFPRINGIRVNRKKRLIYWQDAFKQYPVAYVPEKGDPLAGIIYDKFGLYAFGGFKHFSLHIQIKDIVSGLSAAQLAGVYPTPYEGHNKDILYAIRSFLDDENPEFLNHIGNHYRTLGFYPMITFCNFLALPCCFSRKKANIALENAEKIWQEMTEEQKTAWFTEMQNEQAKVNNSLAEQGLDNRID
ncbi:hypothetical protein [Lonepinella sp. MS14435]|uniref:hypothetical protein n=1 Tax=Lonepinella sp. MS14435 TaxID=3003618 RepID=UPI0036D979F8